MQSDALYQARQPINLPERRKIISSVWSMCVDKEGKSRRSIFGRESFLEVYVDIVS